MTAPPIPYRTRNSQNANIPQHIGAFPPPVYYRDTFGMQPINDRHFTESITTDCSDDSVTTKSTVKTTMNIFHPTTTNNMYESQYTDATYQVEQIQTNQVLILHAKSLLILTLIAFGSAIQLLIFAVICIFFDGTPRYLCLCSTIVFIINAIIIWYFIRFRHARILLVCNTCQQIICLISSIISLLVCCLLFVWTAYLIYGEDRIRENKTYEFHNTDLFKVNYIVRNTRIAMYSLQMIFSSIQFVCCTAIIYILYLNQRSIIEGREYKGYFFTKPTAGHQTVLVPITLKQVQRINNNEIENTSIGVQTSGYQRDV